MSTIMFTAQTVSNVIADLADIRQLNIDIVMCYSHFPESIMSPAETVSYLDALESNGMKGLIDVTQYTQYGVPATPDLTELTARVNNAKNHPALYGWYVCDEPTTINAPVAALRSVYDTIKSVDNHPVVAVYAGWGQADATAYDLISHDIFGIDKYPINGGSFDSAAYTSTLVSKLAGVDPSDSIFNIVQCYGGFDGLAVPTTEQFNSMVDCSVVSGWTRNNHLAFWMWAWDSNNPPTMLKENVSLQEAVRAVALSYTDSPVVPTPRTINDQPVVCTPVTADVAGTQLRIYDNGTIKYFPLVETNAPNASAVRFYDGVQTWALTTPSSGGTRRSRSLSLGLRLGL